VNPTTDDESTVAQNGLGETQPDAEQQGGEGDLAAELAAARAKADENYNKFL
jgi:hypothetical protein